MKLYHVILCERFNKESIKNKIIKIKVETQNRKILTSRMSNRSCHWWVCVCITHLTDYTLMHKRGYAAILVTYFSQSFLYN